MMCLTDSLPNVVAIDGKVYPINTDFRVFIRYEHILKENLTQDVMLEKILLMFYPDVPDDYEAALNAIIWFYNRGEEEDKRHINMKTVGCNGKPAYDLDIDAGRIYAAFMEQYGVDLYDLEYLHWWKFLSMLECLNSDTKMGKVMEYRTIDVNSDKLSKDEKKFYGAMQEYWALDMKISKEEKEQNDALIEALKNGGDVSEILRGGDKH